MKKTIILTACAVMLAMVACSDDEPNNNFKTITKAEELIAAVSDGVDIYVPEGQVIDMSGKPALSVNKAMNVCVDGVVKGISQYITVYRNLTLTGKGRVEFTGSGGFYIYSNTRFDVSDITISYNCPDSKSGCGIYVNGGNVNLENATITSSGVCIFSSQVVWGSEVTANSCKFLSTATQFPARYAIEFPGDMHAKFTDCSISSFYGGVITESPSAHIELENCDCAVYNPTNSNYVCLYAVSADMGGSITLSGGTRIYGEGNFSAVENNNGGAPKGTLIVTSAYINAKPHNIPGNKDIDPADGATWISTDENATFYYPDGSTRQCKMLWKTNNL